MTQPLQPGTCRYCLCTDDRGCEGGCRWIDASKTICSFCRGAEVIAENTVRALQSAAGVAAPRVSLVTTTWSALTNDQRQLLVMTARAVFDEHVQELQLQLDSEAVEAFKQLEDLAEFLSTEASAEFHQADENIPALVKRLLRPHLGKRIILPFGGGA